jgi:hypothetical protein
MKSSLDSVRFVIRGLEVNANTWRQSEPYLLDSELYRSKNVRQLHRIAESGRASVGDRGGKMLNTMRR